MSIFGFGRISNENNASLQLSLFQQLEIPEANIYIAEKGTDNSLLLLLLEKVNYGDTLIIYSVHSIGGTVNELIQIIKLIEDRNVRLVFHLEEIDTSQINGATFYKYNNILINHEHHFSLKPFDRKKGRPKALSPSKVDAMFKWVEKGYSIDRICKKYNISRNTYYNYKHEKESKNS